MAGLISARTGMEILSVYDLVNTRDRYPSAIPVLVALLPTVSDPNVREGIVRALATADARGHATPALLAEYDRSEGPYYRWVVANTLSEVATTEDAAALIRRTAAEPDPKVRHDA